MIDSEKEFDVLQKFEDSALDVLSLTVSRLPREPGLGAMRGVEAGAVTPVFQFMFSPAGPFRVKVALWKAGGIVYEGAFELPPEARRRFRWVDLGDAN